jgi:hypothetical protein
MTAFDHPSRLAIRPVVPKAVIREADGGSAPIAVAQLWHGQS